VSQGEGDAGRSPREVVQQFLSTVRISGEDEAAEQVLAPVVECHQVMSEDDVTLTRTPHEYAEHVRDMRRAFGPFRFSVEEMLVDGDRVYVRWRQSGQHVGPIEGYSPTGLPLVDVGSAVYRVSAGRIAEYWVQVDRAGLSAQLERAIAP
jgi:predicted ester cyclase